MATDPEFWWWGRSQRHAPSRCGRHKYSHIAVLLVTQSNGTARRYELLPGHDKEHFEYRADHKLFRISRDEFLECMRDLGAHYFDEIPAS